MSKTTTELMKRYIAILNITNSKQYICSEYIQTLLKEDYGIDVVQRVVQRDLKALFEVGAVECKGNMPKGWRSMGVVGFGEKMLSFKEAV